MPHRLVMSFQYGGRAGRNRAPSPRSGRTDAQDFIQEDQASHHPTSRRRYHLGESQ